QRDRLLAIGRVVVDESNPLALHLIPAALLIGDKVKNNVGRRPIGAEQREIPLEYGAVARLRAAIAHGDDRDLVDRRLLREREGNAGRERDDVGGAGRTLALEAFVALHAAVDRIAGIAFLEYHLDADDPAIKFVNDAGSVCNAICTRNS